MTGLRFAYRPFILLALLGGCQNVSAPAVADKQPKPDATRRDRIDASLAAASRFLASQQSSDGGWRSKVYGPLNDGPSLTPHVMASLYFLQHLPDSAPGAGASLSSGREYLSTLVDERGEVTAPLRYPVYTAAVASWVVPLADPSERGQREQAAWLQIVRSHQLNEQLGWDPADPAYGGFGYSVVPPRKPPGGFQPDGFRPPLADSNVSATVFGLGALRSAGVLLGDPTYAQILTFARRCQNYSDDPARSDPAFDDGGFFFMPDDPARNKAGAAGTDRLGRTRYRSYGGATADGLRILLHAGLPPDHPRVVAARRWLERNFNRDHNPGAFAPDREVLRDATYFYYCWSVAHAFMHLGVTQLQTTRGAVRWPEALADALVLRQNRNGSWTNAYTDTREDDPLVSTPSAVAALVICRRMIPAEQPAGIVRLPYRHGAPLPATRPTRP